LKLARVRLPAVIRAVAPSAALATAVFLLALDSGAYGVESRGAVGVLLWWTLLVLVGLGLWPRASPPRAALVTGGLLLAFCVLTGASTLWADGEEAAFLELGRAGLYLGVFALAVMAAGRASVSAWTDGLATGIAAVAVLALAERCLSWHDTEPLRTFLPGTETRLSYPVGYWNGLGMLLAIGVPLLLRPAVAARRAVPRGLAAAALPALGAAIYLTSSRGAVAVAAAGAVTFVVLGGRALPALAALAVAAAGTAVAIAVLEARPELVDGPLGTATAAAQGESAALLLVLVSAACGIAHGLLSGSRGAGIPLPRGVAWAAGGAALMLGLVAVAAADPAARLEDFKEPPNQQVTDRPGFVREHLLSGEGSGRWQFWSAAIRQFEEHPVGGGGAGSYGAWWLRDGSLALYVEDAHSLYLETLGELGLVGLVLLLAAFGSALVTALRRARSASADLRPAVAAAAAGAAAFLVGAAVDWIWELTVLGVVGMLCIGLAVGPATAAGSAPAHRVGWPLRAALVVLALCLVAVEAIPWMVHRHLEESRSALASGNVQAAEARARDARAIQPWAASPHLQLALVLEHRGDTAGARGAIARALELEPGNWQLWVVAARVEGGAGNVRRAAGNLRRARELHPRSPLFAQGSD
jgi:tetratricopeptide (TPR) repeat protein